MKKKSSWYSLIFIGMAFFIMEQLLGMLLSRDSDMLHKVYLFTCMLGVPVMMTGIGYAAADVQDKKKEIFYYLLALPVTVLVSVLLQFILFKDEMSKAGHIAFIKNELWNDKAIWVMAFLLVLSIISLVLDKADVWVWFAVMAAAVAVQCVCGGHVTIRQAAIACTYYSLGAALNRSKADPEKLLEKIPCVVSSAVVYIAAFAAVYFNTDKVYELSTVFASEKYPDHSAGAGKVLLVTALTLVLVAAAYSAGTFFSYLFTGMGTRYRSGLVAIVIARYIVKDGWWIGNLKMMSVSHWIMIYTLIAAVFVFIALSESFDIFCQIIFWPVGRFTGKGPKFSQMWANIKKYRYLLRELVKKGIVLKYRRSFFGILWSLLEPLLTMIVLTYVFKNFFGHGDPLYSVYVLTGRLLFSLFQTTTGQALRSVRSNASMIKKVYVPKYMYPLSTILFNFILFMISLIDLLLVMLWYHTPVTVYLLEAFIPIFVMLVFAIGVGMILATVNVFFRDIEYLWNVFMLLLMYCSAIFYKVDSFHGEGAGWMFKLNPVYVLIYNFRLPVYEAKPLDPASMGYATLVAFVTLFVGIVVFYKKQDEFILHI